MDIVFSASLLIWVMGAALLCSLAWIVLVNRRYRELVERLDKAQPFVPQQEPLVASAPMPASPASHAEQVPQADTSAPSEAAALNVTPMAELALELSEAGYWRLPPDQPGMIWLSERLISFTGFAQRENRLYHFERDILPLISAESAKKAAEVRTHIAALQRGELTRYESQHSFKRPTDNAVLWVLFVARAQKEPVSGKICVYGVLQNITRVKQAEMELAAERRRLQVLFDSSPVGLLVAQGGKVYQVNPWLHDLTGMSVGDNPYDYLYGVDISPDRVRANLSENNGLVTGVEVFARDRNNEERVLLTSYHQVISEGEESILAWFVDMTEIKRAQTAFIAAKDAAECAAQAKSRFLANVSHEIRTPMNAIIGLTYLVLQTALTPKQRVDLEKIERSSKALLQLLNDILDVSRIEAGKLELANTEFTLHEVMLNLANLLAMETERKGLELEFRIASGVPGAVRGDALRLGQVLMNLTGNAVKFTDKGDILVCVDVERRTEKGIELRFSVRDSGIGISEEKIAHLFEHFTQADSSSTRRFGGTGLGLSISKSLVELMGGRMQVVSELGKGSTFSFIVPFNLENLQIHEATVAPQAIRGMRVLVVDDTPLARGVVGECLQRMYFRVDMVENGHHAIDAIQKAEQAGAPYKFVLVDWKMPGMDGLELARRIMFEEVLKVKPIILMITAHISGNIFARAERAGIRRVLLKPVNPSVLLDAINDFTGEDGTNPHAGYTVVDTHQGTSLPNGLRVLLAEDNPINQQVVREVLESVGVRVDIAANGREAVKLVREVAFDLVLMDIQMPEMDGIAAAKMLREMPQFKKLPIIAMTAHAMPEDRDKSYAAGMNEHITKPIDPHELFNVIRKWARASKEAANTPETITLPPALQDLPGVNVQSALERLGGNTTLYVSLLHDYHTRYMHLCRVVSQHLDAGDRASAMQLFHDFKGVSASLGVTTLAQSAGTLETALQSGMGEAQVRVSLSALQARLDEVMQGLAHIASLSREPDISEDISPDAIYAVLCEACKMIELNSPEALSVLSSIHAQLFAQLPREMEKLYDALDNFDFEEAKRSLIVIMKKLDMELPN